MKKKIRSPYYELVLYNYSCPSFCSSAKSFHGMLSDIKALMDALAADDESGHHDHILNSFRAWEQGDTEATHRVAYHEYRLLTPEEVIEYEDYTFENVIWQHTNIWGCFYEMKADTVDISQIVVKQGNRYIRCIRPVFKDLMVRIPDTQIPELAEWKPVGDRFWGYPRMMARQGRYTYPRLYVLQEYYNDMAEAVTDLYDETKIDYAAVCEEIFGDG